MQTVTLKSEKPASLVGRRVKAIAYTGDLLNYIAGPLVIDLATTTAKAPMALLVDHETDKRAGVADQFRFGADLALEGYFLSNPTGAQVQAELEAGFPWQMSIRVDPGRVEELTQGASAMVNGRNVQGPARVFRDSTIHEISFTALGVDSNTSAAALASGAGNPLIADAKRRSGDGSSAELSRSQNPLVQNAKRRRDAHHKTLNGGTTR